MLPIHLHHRKESDLTFGKCMRDRKWVGTIAIAETRVESNVDPNAFGGERK